MTRFITRVVSIPRSVIRRARLRRRAASSGITSVISIGEPSECNVSPRVFSRRERHMPRSRHAPDNETRCTGNRAIIKVAALKGTISDHIISWIVLDFFRVSVSPVIIRSSFLAVFLRPQNSSLRSRELVPDYTTRAQPLESY